jgi:hypothetical protein
MLISLWRRWWHRTPVSARRNGPSGKPHLAYRPQIESLEAREVPAVWKNALLALIPVGDAASIPQQIGNPLPEGITPLRVTVRQNAAESVLDLGPVFAALPGLQQKGGLQLTILGNTNARLVTPDLSGSALTLSYTRGLSGTATITVNAMDADRVCVQQTIVVTVRPRAPVTGAVSLTPIVPMNLPNPLGSSQ